MYYEIFRCVCLDRLAFTGLLSCRGFAIYSHHLGGVTGGRVAAAPACKQYNFAIITERFENPKIN